MKMSAYLAIAVLGLGIAAPSQADDRATKPAGAPPAKTARGDAVKPAAARGEALKPAAGRDGPSARAGAARDGAAKIARGDAPKLTNVKPDGARAGAAVDKRQANQDRRIEQGVKKGQITGEELTKLTNLENDINTLETSLKSDGKLTRDEAALLRKGLNAASLQIWAERHDTDGNQKPAARLGKEIFATDALTAKIESGDLTKAEAKSFLGDFKKLVNLKRRLGTEELPAEQRAKLQAQYNELLNKYFIQKTA
jgi:hypothetical protein